MSPYRELRRCGGPRNCEAENPPIRREENDFGGWPGATVRVPLLAERLVILATHTIGLDRMLV